MYFFFSLLLVSQNTIKIDGFFDDPDGIDLLEFSVLS